MKINMKSPLFKALVAMVSTFLVSASVASSNPFHRAHPELATPAAIAAMGAFIIYYYLEQKKD